MNNNFSLRIKDCSAHAKHGNCFLEKIIAADAGKIFKGKMSLNELVNLQLEPTVYCSLIAADAHCQLLTAFNIRF